MFISLVRKGKKKFSKIVFILQDHFHVRKQEQKNDTTTFYPNSTDFCINFKEKVKECSFGPSLKIVGLKLPHLLES